METYYAVTQGVRDRVKDIDFHAIMHMRMLNKLDIAENEKLSSAPLEKPRELVETPSQMRYSLCRDITDDMKTDGFTMTYKHGAVIRQGDRNHFYRGENKIHPYSISTLNREQLSMTEEKRALSELIADMRIAEFGMLISEFDHVANWKYSDVHFDMIAQHYGMKTHWLDITSDFDVALFFANCYYDEPNHRFLPIINQQKCISDNKKYGVIFHIPACISSFSQLQDNERSESTNNAIVPIGFQPFYRCHAQHGYGIYMSGDTPIQDDARFEMLRFRHDERIATMIYDEMDGGRKVYPYEGIR